MRRTYKSKKDTGGGLDHREMVFNMDEKSSAFDAFYIQNIKQTKRELSCIGSSNQYGVAGNKVRKRKYVRRIVKEVESLPRESLSNSVFLTPDKSIRVNKAPDLFDQLLNSSSTCSGPKQSKAEALLDQIRADTPKQTKTYRRSVKKVNYCNESFESDKENSNDSNNPLPDVTDIRAHELVIEKESANKKVDDSINNIVRKLSLIINTKGKNSYGTDKKTYKSNKNRLTMNIRSPSTITSPLSSTPYTEKQKNQSIYQFSPISMDNLEESQNNVSIENANESNKSIILVLKNNSNAFKRSKKKEQVSPITELSKNANSKSLFSSNADTKDASSNRLPVPALQTSELEPFLGFQVETKSEDDNVIMTKDKNDSVIISSRKTSKNHQESSGVNKTCPETSLDNTCTENINSNAETNDDSNIYISDIKCTVQIPPLALTEKDKLYKSLEESVPSEPFLGFDKVDLGEIAELCEDEHTLSTSAESSRIEYSNNSSDTTDDDNQSLYGTCSSESCVNEEIKAKEPIVIMERINISLFNQYYKKIRNYGSYSKHISLEDSLSEDVSDDFKSFVTGNDPDEINDDESIKSLEKDLSSSEEQLCKELDSSENKETSILENECSDEDRCISFVTTRRRNYFANNSTILVLNDSQDSVSGSNCDKTVLSNNNVCLISPKKEAITDINVEVNENVDMNESCELITANSEIIEDESPKTDTRTSTITTRKSKIYSMESNVDESPNISRVSEMKPGIVLQPGKKWERSLSIYRRMTTTNDHFDHSILDEEDLHTKGRKYRQSVIDTMQLQDCQGLLHNESIISRRCSIGPKPSRSTIRIVKETSNSRVSLSSTTVLEDLQGFLEDCDDTIIELSKLSIADDHDVTILDKFHESNRIATARDYVLRRCNQSETLPFDECYPDPLLKNCRKIGEGVYGEVFLWRAPDGRARVMKVVPIAGDIKVNGEQQKDFHEIISEIVIAMELSALRAPIAQIECHFDEGKEEVLDLHSVENATDVFNEVLAVRCVFGSYPSRLLDLWELYDETRGSENDSPGVLPAHQQFIVLELSNAGQDLESYNFDSADQAHALFLQVAFGLAVGEEAFQFEHRDLHWGNVLIAPTDQKYATFVLRGRLHRVLRRGVAATIIDYSLSRVSVPLAGPGDSAALYNDLATDDGLFAAVGDYQFQVYRLMRDKLGNDWKNFEPYTNILWLHYIVDKMITALRYKRTTTKNHKQYIAKLKAIKERILNYGSAAQFVITDNEY